MAHKLNDCRTTYDHVADEYVRRIFEELQHKPLDRQLLDRFATSVREVGPACDMGCGPGHVARYLHELGVQVCGVDLSPEMVKRARQLTPEVEFREGDMMALDAPDATWAGITAFYSIIHIARGDIVRTLEELRRVLRPGGLLLLAFHIFERSGGAHRFTGVCFRKGRELLNHNVRLSATDSRFDRFAVEDIGKGRFDALFDQRLIFIWRSRQSDDGVSFGKQFRYQRTTNRSRSSGNKNLHL